MNPKKTLPYYNSLISFLEKYDRVLVAFSGGIDSAFLLKVCVSHLGKERVLGVTAISPSLSDFEKKLSQKIAQEIGARHRFIYTQEIENASYQENSYQRCFFCKSELYKNLSQLSKEENYDLIVNGANADDKNDFRPGQKAREDYKVLSPLQDLGFTKEMIRKMAKDFGLSIWNKPASPCLASRIPYYQEVSRKKLGQIEKAEAYLRELSFLEFRVRHHGDLARIECSAQDQEFLWNSSKIRKDINEYFQSIGFAYVSIDILDFSSGRMNKVLKKSLATEKF